LKKFIIGLIMCSLIALCLAGCSDQKGGPGSTAQGVVGKVVWKGVTYTYTHNGALDAGQVGKQLGTVTIGHDGKLKIYSVQGEPTSKEIAVVQPTTDGYTLYKK
jgi:hypothetical protein